MCAPRPTASLATQQPSKAITKNDLFQHLSEQEDFTVRPLTIAAMLAIVFFSLPSHAEDVRSANTDKVKWLSIPEVHARLESAGYRNIEKIEREGGSYEVKATDQAGRRIKLYVHPQTGEVIDQRQREVRRDKYGGYARNNQRNFPDCNERRCRDDLAQQGTPQPIAGK
jgi:hypothetical protein